MWAALGHRRGQVLVLLLVSALVATCAAFAPIFARSIDQAVLRSHVEQADPADISTSVSQVRTQSREQPTPESITAEVPDGLRDISEEPIGEISLALAVQPRSDKQPSPVVLRSRDDACRHVRVTSGRCPSAADEILVSDADVRAWDWRLGTELGGSPQHPAPGQPDASEDSLEVVGTYRVPKEDAAYWLGARPDGKSGVPQPDLDYVPGMDDFLTVDETFGWGATVQVDLPVDPDATTLDSLPQAASAAGRLAEDHPELSVSTSASTLEKEVTEARAQTSIIVPFIALQLALLAVVVLFLVAQAAVEQRRHDVALARLRGRSRAGARRLLLTELSVPVVLGVPVGLLVAMALSAMVRMIVLPPGVPYEVPSSTLVWLLAALLVSLAAVAVAARPVLREPVSALLREIGPTHTSGPRLVETVVVVLAVLGVIGLATGALSGPAALAAPTLLAIAVGLLASRLLPVIATRRAARAMRRGRISGVLAAHGLARRPSARRALVVTTVATAVAVFGADAVVVADHNREARAELETGAPAVVDVGATSTGELTDAAEELDRAGITASPVVTIQPNDSDADATIAVDPRSFASAAHPRVVSGLDLADFELPDQDPVLLEGKKVTGEVAWEITRSTGVEEPPVLKVDVTTATGEQLSRDLRTLGPKKRGTARIDADLLCPDTCRLDGLRVSSSGSTGSELVATLTISDLGVDGKRLPLGGDDTWAAPDEAAGGEGVTVTTKGEDLRLEAVAADGGDVTAVVADVPRPLPAIVTSEGGRSRQVVTVDGGQATVRPVQRVRALPAVTDQGVLVSLPMLARLSQVIDTERAHAELWLDDASPTTLERVREVVDEQGLGIRSVRTTAQAKDSFDDSASGWGLQLALLAGGLAVLLAALVLVVLAVTGWRSAVADIAALRVSGVGRREAARAVRAEHLTTVAVGVVLGGLCAVVGAAVAMPSIPLFTEPAAVPVPDLSPVWWAVLLSAAVAAAVLLVLAGVLAHWTMGRVRLAAAKGEPT